ncbi:unnamed protein product [Allacma fusca]|uniref:RING-type domain-containing protein n=1 Tax=Allacma fusca TaxID=39272 RepID=A0A8J2LXY0_9HEXA|nr:unnamed protein product [Allacma fusca]
MSSSLRCGICLVYSSFKEGDYFLTTPCGHIFHFECFRERIYRVPHNGVCTCPACKRKIHLSRAVKLEGISPADPSVSSKLASLKFIIIGDSGVGKTGLLLQYARGVFPQQHSSTVGCDLTFDHLEKWITMVKENSPADVHMILIGNKFDLRRVREVTPDKGKALASELGINFLETSAKEATNVEAAFRALTASTLDSLQQAGKIDALKLIESERRANSSDVTCTC